MRRELVPGGCPPALGCKMPQAPSVRASGSKILASSAAPTWAKPSYRAPPRPVLGLRLVRVPPSAARQRRTRRGSPGETDAPRAPRQARSSPPPSTRHHRQHGASIRKIERPRGQQQGRGHGHEVEYRGARRNPAGDARRDRGRNGDEARMISASRCVETPSRHRRDSFPRMMDVGGFFLIFEAVRTEWRDAPRRCCGAARKKIGCVLELKLLR